MKQILQSLKEGHTTVSDVPMPRLNEGENLIRTTTSLVSAGTERMLVEFGNANIAQKIRSQPEKVKTVLEKAKVDGLIATYEAVKSKLDQPLCLGYCNVGRIVESRASGFSEGERVVSNGQHAEYVSVTKNLCASIPDNVTDEQASFTVLASIGLQGIRLAKPSLGECVVVIGLGLIGLLTIQMLKAQGCRVLGVDIDDSRLELARAYGAETVSASFADEVLIKSQQISRGYGVDAVIITASTKSNEVISQAAKICRKRARIVLVGVVGLNLNRGDFYDKEITFQVSCSYGPGRYDPNYEVAGNDYPIGYVRWTEKRNFQAVLDMMSEGTLDVSQLITHRFNIEDGEAAYKLLLSGESALGIILSYPFSELPRENERLIKLNKSQNKQLQHDTVRVGVLGAGNHSGRTLIPALKKSGAFLHTLVSNGGVTAAHHGAKFGFEYVSTDTERLLENKDINAVVITTRHNLHADQVTNSLKNGKHVFCEKPLCITLDELTKIREVVSEHPDQLLMVGYNRRFSPLVKKMKELTSNISSPKSMIITVNAGEIPFDHWTQNRQIGGGRIIGEGCHFVDLARHIIDSEICSVVVKTMSEKEQSVQCNDTVSCSIQFLDGSICTIHYFSNGNSSFGKERIDLFCNNKVLQLDNFQVLRGWGWSNFRNMRLWKQDKGQLQCVSAFIHAIKNGVPAPIKIEEILEISERTIEISDKIMEK
jgi:predicted dehydrogenase